MSELVVSGVYQGLSRDKGWVPLLSDVSFEVERGEVVAIIGSRRSGKTTLLEIAAGIRLPERGSVRLRDRELTVLSQRKRQRLLRDELVWLSRAGMEQKLKIEDMVGWSLAWDGYRKAKRRGREMLERVGALDLAEKRWPDLSPWDQVLVGYARAFIGRPRIVLIDDLLDGLGSRATEQASDLLRSLLEGAEYRCGVLLSASDNDSAVFADRVWAIARGGKLAPTTGHRDLHADIVPFPRPRRSGDTTLSTGHSS